MHNIDMTNNRANMAFLGDRANIWHGLGQAMQPGMSIADWAKAAGLDWKAIKVPLWANVASLGLKDAGGQAIRGMKLPEIALVRNDTGAALGIATNTYQQHQPDEVLDWFDRYTKVDPRFQIDTAGSLKGGKIIWAQAKFGKDLIVAGDKHNGRLLMTTSFDTTKATINSAVMTRVVCNNTLTAAVADGGESTVRTRHNTKFDAGKVGAELARIASGFEKYKDMGDALAKIELSKVETQNFFKSILDIPFNAKEEDVSTRKLNQLGELKAAYATTLQEGTKPLTSWAALNAVTRYVDHYRSVRGGTSNNEARVLSSQFGSGAALKAKAVQLLLGRNGEIIEQEVDAPAQNNLDAVLDMMGA